MTPTDLLSYWQKRLALSDWQITLEFADLGRGRAGEVRYSLNDMRAKIKLNPDEDAETTLIHELLEIHFAELDLPFHSQRKKEQVLNVLSRVLVELRDDSWVNKTLELAEMRELFDEMDNEPLP